MAAQGRVHLMGYLRRTFIRVRRGDKFLFIPMRAYEEKPRSGYLNNDKCGLIS